MGTKRFDDLKEARRSKRSRPPRNLYHASPWRLRPGTNLRPHWNLWEFHHAVWMCSSLHRARQAAKSAVESLRDGCGGFAGTGWDPEDSPPRGSIRGSWIYRVKPTGPVERCCPKHWTSHFPVRVIEVVGRWGLPEANDCPPPRWHLDHEVARLFLRRCYWGDPIEELLSESENVMAKPRAERLEYVRDFIVGIGWERDAGELLQIYEASRDAAEREARLRGWVARETEHQRERLRRERRRTHHKLFPDRRYRRNRDRPPIEED